MVKRKSFIISTIIILILIVIGFNVPNIIKAFKGNSSEAEKDKLLIVDTENIFEGTLNSLNNMELGYEANTTNENISFEKIKEKIENKEIDEAIIIEKNQENYKIRYIIEDATMVQKIPTTLENAISSIYSNLQISKLGLTEEQIKGITPNFI